MLEDAGFELRHLRTFVTVAQRGSFTRAADDLHIAQQAVSQQIRSLERTLGVKLLTRNSRLVSLTTEGTVFLADAKRVLATANRASRRVQAARRGELGSLRIGYTLTTAWDTMPSLLSELAERLPQLKVEAREVFGGDIADLLSSGRYDLALAPATNYPPDIRRHTLRREPLQVALGEKHPLAENATIGLRALSEAQFELWPHAMAPGFYDTVLGACRAAGFEPRLDDRATGNTVWGYIARGRGVGLINGSLAKQLPRGIKLVDIADPPPSLAIDAVWLRDDDSPVLARTLEVLEVYAAEQGWI